MDATNWIIVGVAIMCLTLVTIMYRMARKLWEADLIGPEPLFQFIPRSEENEPSIVSNREPSVDRERVNKNIRRFTKAIEQNQKGKLRERELRKNLEYWRLQDKALKARGE